MQIVVSSKGQIVLPAEFRREDDIRPGEAFEVIRVKRGEYRLERKEKPANEGLVKLLLSCPEKGFFVPLPDTDTTDDLRSPFAGPTWWMRMS
jgi:AbrB family looped-hinge helix DNA binding protein